MRPHLPLPLLRDRADHFSVRKGFLCDADLANDGNNRRIAIAGSRAPIHSVLPGPDPNAWNAKTEWRAGGGIGVHAPEWPGTVADAESLLSGLRSMGAPLRGDQ